MSARAAVAALLLCAGAPPASAEVLQFVAGPSPKADWVFSGDGYHYSYFAQTDAEDQWIVDGSPRVRTPRGGLPQTTPALSADGRTLLHLVAGRDGANRPGVAAAVNGRKVGGVYPQIEDLRLSPGGGNAAYLINSGGQWAVVSGQGTGPGFPVPPSILGVSDRAVAYLGSSGGATWLYKNHQPVGRVEVKGAAMSADLTRFGGLMRAPGAAGAMVEIDGKRYGPYADATVPVFSPNGRHAGFMARNLRSRVRGYDLVIVDGQPARSAPCHDCTLQLDDAGRVFQDRLLIAADPLGEFHLFTVDGVEIGRPPRVGFAPGGRHFVYTKLTGRGGGVCLDGKVIEEGAPMSIPGSKVPIEFDGPDEYHYWTIMGTELRLVCGSIGRSRASDTRCAALGRSIYRPAPAE